MCIYVLFFAFFWASGILTYLINPLSPPLDVDVINWWLHILKLLSLKVGFLEIPTKTRNYYHTENDKLLYKLSYVKMNLLF